MTDDEKKALIIAGGVGVLALAWYLTKGSILPPGAIAIQGAPVGGGSGPGYMDYNVAPFNSPSAATLGKVPLDQIANQCCDDNSCRSAGGINTGNAPTSVEQLLNWYSNDHPDLASFMAKIPPTYERQQLTVAEQAAPAPRRNLLTDVVFSRRYGLDLETYQKNTPY